MDELTCILTLTHFTFCLCLLPCVLFSVITFYVAHGTNERDSHHEFLSVNGPFSSTSLSQPWLANRALCLSSPLQQSRNLRFNQVWRHCREFNKGFSHKGRHHHACMLVKGLCSFQREVTVRQGGAGRWHATMQHLFLTVESASLLLASFLQSMWMFNYIVGSWSK